ncbi:Uncharacterized protein DBV15_01648 [Temnothorax longispinosus]|uniref:Uncharacterized protein n=1 Tax=Temnothorax longispinosus TaxID=300112 RepID=A0A4S2L126_9HYME|nr:Uncharacterized protein DBV15_01648 [Temnothorax longispinosus]
MTRNTEQSRSLSVFIAEFTSAGEDATVAQRRDPRYSEVWRYRGYTPANARGNAMLPVGLSVERITKIVKGSEVDRMAPRVIAAETIAAISYPANSLSSHPRRFGSGRGTPGNVHPGNFGFVLPVSSLFPPPALTAVPIAEVEHCPTFR